MALFSHVCKDCAKRKLHCHASCKEYLEAKAKHDATTALEREVRAAEHHARCVAFNMKKG